MNIILFIFLFLQNLQFLAKRTSLLKEVLYTIVVKLCSCIIQIYCFIDLNVQLKCSVDVGSRYVYLQWKVQTNVKVKQFVSCDLIVSDYSETSVIQHFHNPTFSNPTIYEVYNHHTYGKSHP